MTDLFFALFKTVNLSGSKATQHVEFRVDFHFRGQSDQYPPPHFLFRLLVLTFYCLLIMPMPQYIWIIQIRVWSEFYCWYVLKRYKHLSVSILVVAEPTLTIFGSVYSSRYLNGVMKKSSTTWNSPTNILDAFRLFWNILRMRVLTTFQKNSRTVKWNKKYVMKFEISRWCSNGVQSPTLG